MYSNDTEAEAFVASGDLSTCLNRIVSQLSTDFKIGLATAGAGFGVLLNAPKDGEFASVATDGVALVYAGAAVTAGQYVTAATSGWAVVVTSGSGQEVLGKVRVGAASGMLAAVAIDYFYRPNSVGN